MTLPGPSRSSLILLLLPFLLSACAQHIPLTQADYAAIRSVSVLKQSNFPNENHIMIYAFSQNATTSLGEPVGSAMGQNEMPDAPATLRWELLQNRIDPGYLVSDEFERQLHESGLFPAIHYPADAEFSFDIRSVGLSIPHGFDTRLNPVLAVGGELTRSDGKVIWKHLASVLGEDIPYGGHNLNEYFSQPQLLQAAYASAARVVVAMLIEDLRKDMK